MGVIASRERVAVIVVLAVAAYFRFHRLDEYPPGLYYDVGVNGLDAIDILNGKVAIFFERNNGREALFLYYQAALLGLIGFHPFVFNLSGAFMSLLGVALVYRLFRDWFGHGIALATAALYSVTLWPIVAGRIGLRMTLIAPVTVLALLLFHRAMMSGHRRAPLLGGLVAALSLYTHLAARIVPVTLVAIALAARPARAAWPRLAIVGAAFFVAALPLTAYFALQPDRFFGRASQTAIVATEPGPAGAIDAMRTSAERVAAMFTIAGDPQRRHNIPGRPVFEWPLNVLFVVGLVVAVARSWNDDRYRRCLIWFAIGLLPTLLATESPHFLRAIGIAPVIMLYPVLAIDAAFGALGVAVLRSRLLPVACALLFALLIVRSHHLYFDVWASHVDTYASFDTHFTEIADLIDSREEPHLLFAIERDASVYVLSERARAGIWQPESSAVVTIPLASGGLLIAAERESALARVAPEALPGLVDLTRSRPGLLPDFRAFAWSDADRQALLSRMRPFDTGPQSQEANGARRFSIARRSDARFDLHILWELDPGRPWKVTAVLVQADGPSFSVTDLAAPPLNRAAGPVLTVTHTAFAAPSGRYRLRAAAQDESAMALAFAGPFVSEAEVDLTD